MLNDVCVIGFKIIVFPSKIASLGCNIHNYGQKTSEWTDLFALDGLESLYYVYE